MNIHDFPYINISSMLSAPRNVLLHYIDAWALYGGTYEEFNLNDAAYGVP